MRDAAEFGTLRVSDSGLGEVLDNWERTLSALCMAFAQELGVDVSVVRPHQVAEPQQKPQGSILGTQKTNIEQPHHPLENPRLVGRCTSTEVGYTNFRGGQQAIKKTREAAQRKR